MWLKEGKQNEAGRAVEEKQNRRDTALGGGGGGVAAGWKLTDGVTGGDLLAAWVSQWRPSGRPSRHSGQLEERLAEDWGGWKRWAQQIATPREDSLN